MGKGSGRRPAAISHAEFAENYNRIFRSEPSCDCHKHEHQCCNICQGAERDDDGRVIDDGGEIEIAQHQTAREAMHEPYMYVESADFKELRRDAQIARHLKRVLPLIYKQMEKELADGWT